MALPATDNFDRSNGGLGSNWTTTIWAAPQIISQEVGGTAGSEYGARWTADSPDADQYAQFERSNDHDIVTGEGGPGCRFSSSDCVIIWYITEGSRYIKWYNGGSWTQIGGSYATNAEPNDIDRLEASGTTFTAYVNDTQRIQGSNASAPGSGTGGIYFYEQNWRFDDFEVGNLAAGDLSVSVSDGATVADSPTITPLVLEGVAESDGLTLGDTPTANLTIEVVASDGVELADAVTMAGESYIAASDALTVADSPTITPLVLGDVSVSDALTIGDTATVTLVSADVYEIGVSDALTVADSDTVAIPNLGDISVSDAITLGEDATPLLIEPDLNADKGADDYANWVVGVRLYTP